VGDEGLARIQPGDSRGRERGVIVVSDSTTIFMAGKRTFGDLAPDFAGMREGSGILRVFVDPNTPNWAQNLDNMQALGVWPEGKPMVNSVQILGDAFPTDYKLPIEYREAVRMFSSMPEDEDTQFLMDNFPFDQFGERVYPMRHAEIQQAAEDCPDPWESSFIPPPEEPVTGIRDVAISDEMMRWHYAQQEAITERSKEYASKQKPSRPAKAVATSSSSLAEDTATFDEVLAAIPYRTPDNMTIAGIKKIREAEKATRAEAKAARDPQSGGRKLPLAEDLIGYDWGDDADISDMYGVYDEQFGAHDADDMMIINKTDIPRGHLKQPSKWLDKPGKFLIGVVRGAVGRLPSRNGRWVSLQELLDFVEKQRSCWIGRRWLLSVIAYDNKGRLQMAGSLEDKRSQHVDCGIWPLWIAAIHGHSNKISSVVDDNDIATSWYMNMSRADLGNTAAFQGTPR
ncbi:unnamed protein product, partial [Symbiodinium sp. KB8]